MECNSSGNLMAHNYSSRVIICNIFQHTLSQSVTTVSVRKRLLSNQNCFCFRFGTMTVRIGFKYSYSDTVITVYNWMCHSLNAFQNSYAAKAIITVIGCVNEVKTTCYIIATTWPPIRYSEHDKRRTEKRIAPIRLCSLVNGCRQIVYLKKKGSYLYIINLTGTYTSLNEHKSAENIYICCEKGRCV